jgi:hypothetical protein
MADDPVHVFEADYYKNVQQVFKDLIVWHISSYQNLGILAACCGGHSSGEQVLPAWADDWEKERGKLGCVPLFLSPFSHRLYHACGVHKDMSRICLQIMDWWLPVSSSMGLKKLSRNG